MEIDVNIPGSSTGTPTEALSTSASVSEVQLANDEAVLTSEPAQKNETERQNIPMTEGGTDEADVTSASIPKIDGDVSSTLNNFISILEVATKKNSPQGCNRLNCVINGSETIRCGQCNANVHYECTRLPGYQIHRFLTASHYRKFVCEVCCGEIPENFTAMDDTDRTVTEALQSSGETLNANWKEIVAEKDDLIAKRDRLIKSLKESVENALPASRENLTKEAETIRRLEKCNTDLKDQVQSSGKENDLLLGRVRSLEATHEEIDGKLQNTIRVLQKAEETIKAKSDLVDAKNEIIENLKLRLNEKNAPVNVDATANETQPQDIPKEGVNETCEFVRIHATSGVAINSFLVWADIQRQLHPDDHWKPLAVKGFIPSEITEAKELLWRTSDKSLIGKMTKRQGTSKSTSEVNDICTALKKLSEKNCVPLFISTSDMVAQTPIFNSRPLVSDSDIMKNKLVFIEESINTLKDVVETYCKSPKPVLQHIDVDSDTTSSDEGKNEDFPFQLGGTIPITDIEMQCDSEDQSEWKEMTRKRRSNNANNNNRRKSVQFAATSSLVIYGVGKDVTTSLIREYLGNKNIEVLECDLLTKHEQPNSLSFKVTVKAIDLQTAKNKNTWPNGVGVRMFNQPGEKKKTPRSNTNNRNNNQGANVNNRKKTQVGNNQSQNQQLQAGSNVDPGVIGQHSVQTIPSHTIPPQLYHPHIQQNKQQQTYNPQAWSDAVSNQFPASVNRQSILQQSASLQSQLFPNDSFSRNLVGHAQKSDTSLTQPPLRFVDRLGTDTFAQYF